MIITNKTNIFVVFLIFIVVTNGAAVAANCLCLWHWRNYNHSWKTLTSFNVLSFSSRYGRVAHNISSTIMAKWLHEPPLILSSPWRILCERWILASAEKLIEGSARGEGWNNDHPHWHWTRGVGCRLVHILEFFSLLKHKMITLIYKPNLTWLLLLLILSLLSLLLLFWLPLFEISPTKL